MSLECLFNVIATLTHSIAVLKINKLSIDCFIGTGGGGLWGIAKAQSACEQSQSFDFEKP